MGSISLPLRIGGQQVAIGVPVGQPEALTGLDTQRGHDAGPKAGTPEACFQKLPVAGKQHGRGLSEGCLPV